jgi:acetyl-CoA synthetase
LFRLALDWFDAELAAGRSGNHCALRIIGENAADLSFSDMASRSNQIANGLRKLGLERGDRILLMLGNVTELRETMLAAIKLGAVVIINLIADRGRPGRKNRACPCPNFDRF